MKRRIKPIFFNLFVILILLILIFFTYDKLINTSNENIDINVDLINSETLTLTQLIIQTSEINERGPRPKPEKVAYITIDDGPSKYTKEIVDILEKNNVKATFFMVDGNMRKYQQELQLLANKGHSLGFHSVSHDIDVLYQTPEVTVSEFNKCRETLEDITNKTSRLIRLPYGSKPYATKESYKALIDSGYKIWDWNLDTQDWRATDKEIIENVKMYSGQYNEIVLLMHEKEQSVKALQGIIDTLREKGYTILPIEENYKHKNYWEQNLTK